MFKHKLTGALLAVTVAAAGTALFLPHSIDANAARIQLDPTNASLFLPETYEQYLSLDAPVDVAVCERYVAIAEQDVLYVFDRTEETPVYHTYRHGPSHANAQISKIQFSDAGDLYLSDSLLGFYRLDFSDLNAITPTSEKALTSLSTFYIVGETLFEASVVDKGTTYLSAPLGSPSDVTTFDSSDNKVTPQLGFSDGNFYSVVGTLVTVYRESEEWYAPTGNMTLQTALSGLQAATVVGNDLFYTVDGSPTVADGLYSFGLTSQTSALLFGGDGFGALTSYGGKLYAVKGNAVMEYSLENGVEKTDFEISSASDSVNRLSGAQDGVRAGDLLVSADGGNGRISVYHMETGEYSVISDNYKPTHVATDGTIIAAASDATVYLYAWDSRAERYVRVFDYNAEYAVTGLACLYGKCYFVTNGFGYGVIAEDPAGEAGNYVLAASNIRATLSRDVPAALTNDLYGNLYVVLTDGSVFQYTEASFADKNIAQGERMDCVLPAGFSSVRADFEGNIYYLSGTVLYQNGQPIASVDGKNFVYSKDGLSLSPLTYALGFEDDRIYFNFGDFVVCSKEGVLGFPTLRTIDAAGVYETLGQVHAPETVRLLDVGKNAVGIKVDLSSLGQDTQYFPFTSYARTADAYRGVLLAEQGDFRLVALYHDRSYDVRLFRKEQCEIADVAVEESAGDKYLSSPCNLYNYPCISDAFTETLPRGTTVRVLSVIHADEDREKDPDLGYDFAYIEAETPARATLRGYVPASFLTDIDPSSGESETFEIVKLKSDTAFTDDYGLEKKLEAGTEVRIYTNGDGTYTGKYVSGDGMVYMQTLTEEMIDRGQSDALRIALIVILSVLALVIIGAYFALLPREKKKRKNS